MPVKPGKPTESGKTDLSSEFPVLSPLASSAIEALFPTPLPAIVFAGYSAKLLCYRSDVYRRRGSAYYPIVVWQFWGRAAEAS